MATQQTDQIEPTFDTESALKVLANEQMDRQNGAARELRAFVEDLQQRKRCVVRAVPFVTPDGRLDAQIAVNALPLE